ncbi:MAG: FRG domain-containing protein [Anaerolineales bacterium]|nr:FRG domain-containing protein [Anaerolineales bacterium]
MVSKPASEPRRRQAGTGRARQPRHVSVETIDSWDSYLRLVNGDSYRNWAFRGQADAAWQLWPSITRELQNRQVKSQYWTNQESRIFRIFQRKALQLLEKVPDIADTFRWMALMQHHGAPTRLLDFTWSPYVAAFFALESSTTDAAVWAINTLRLGTYSFTLRSHEDDPMDLEKALKLYYSYSANDVAFGEPFFMDQRLIAQSGTFACPFDLTRPINEILGRRRDTVAKFVLRGSGLRKQALSELYRMNITHATLFPDLYGLARSLRYELESHWEYDPTAQ